MKFSGCYAYHCWLSICGVNLFNSCLQQYKETTKTNILLKKLLCYLIDYAICVVFQLVALSMILPLTCFTSCDDGASV